MTHRTAMRWLERMKKAKVPGGLTEHLVVIPDDADPAWLRELADALEKKQ